MKKTAPTLFMAAIASLLFISLQACNQRTNKHEHATGEHHHNRAEAGDHDHHHDHAHAGDTSDMLTLNNGAKWLADESTNNNAKTLISIGEEFSKDADKTLADYHTFGKDINAAINVMISECTMEGKADEALHHWFLPVLSQARALEAATDTTGLSDVTSAMVHRLKTYSDYFE